MAIRYFVGVAPFRRDDVSVFRDPTLADAAYRRAVEGGKSARYVESTGTVADVASKMRAVGA